MVARTMTRGHAAIYDPDRGWVYEDTGDPTSVPRACARCGEMPTPEGYDACLGHIPGAVSVCCGHGVEPEHISTGHDVSGH
jgi:hypothetical protein